MEAKEQWAYPPRLAYSLASQMERTGISKCASQIIIQARSHSIPRKKSAVSLVNISINATEYDVTLRMPENVIFSGFTTL